MKVVIYSSKISSVIIMQKVDIKELLRVISLNKKTILENGLNLSTLRVYIKLTVMCLY